MHFSARITESVRDSDGKVTRSLPASSVPEWLAVALSNPAVAKAIRRFAAGGESWVEPYRILEVIIEDVGTNNLLVQRGWYTASKIRTFKHTANSVAATGDEARHGADHKTPPKNPMRISEGKSLVSVLLHSWLQEKANTAALAI